MFEHTVVVKESTQDIKKKKKLFQKGLSLIEASMVLALAAVVVGGVMLYYQSASNSNRLNTATNQLVSIVSGVSNVYANQGDLGGATGAQITAALIKSKAVPANSVSGLNIVSPFGQNIVIKEVAGQRSHYIIQIPNVPEAVCAQLASTPLGYSLLGLGIVDKATPVADPAATPPLPAVNGVVALSDIQTNCKAAGSDINFYLSK